MKLRSVLKDKKFISSCKSFFKKNKDKLLDIILFGSAVRGKEDYNDIDILLLFKDKLDLDLVFEFKSLFPKLDVSVTGKIYNDIFKSSFLAREGILSDGYSIIHNKFLHQLYGYNTYYLFKYSLNGFSTSSRVKFHYALYGRGRNKGMIKRVGGIKFSQTIVLVPMKNADTFKEFLESIKIEFTYFPILIPERVVP